MLDLPSCSILSSHHAPAVSGVTALEEGVALVYVMEDGTTKIQASTGVAGERFAGCCQIRHITPNSAVSSAATTVPDAAPYTITLADTPRTGEIQVKINGAVAADTGGGTGEYTIAANVITFDATDAGLDVEVTYRYDLSVAKANMLFGTNATQQNLGADFEVGFIKEGDVFTSNYNVADDWADTAADIKLDADGMFSTSSATGETIDAMVIATPAQGGGFLGLRLKP